MLRRPRKNRRKSRTLVRLRFSLEHPQMRQLSLQPGNSRRRNVRIAYLQLPEVSQGSKVGQALIANFRVMKPKRLQFPQNTELRQPGVGDARMVQGQELKFRERPQVI